MAKRKHETGGQKDTFPTGTELELQSGATLDHQSGATLVLHGDTLSAAETGSINITTAGQSENSKALVLDSSGVIDIASGDELNIDGTFSIGDVNVGASAAEIDLNDGRTTTTAQLEQLNTSPVAGALGGSALLVVSRVVTIAEINAGHVLVAALAGRTISVHSFRIVVNGGAVTSNTSVELEDDNGTPVVIASFTQASLTENAVFSNGLVVAGQTDNTPLALTAAKGISITNTDTDITVATSITVTLHYSVVDA